MSHGWSAEPMLDPQYARRRMAPMDPASNAAYTHSRTRTTSSNTFPAGMHGVYSPNPYQQQTHLAHPQAYHQRRSPSVNTFSTVSSGGGMPPPAAYRTSPTIDIRRSTSSRSGGTTNSPQSGSYVALLRRQKATVWSDRAQPEDPRLLAQQRAAKMRANREVVGGSGLGITPVAPGRTSTGLSSTGGKVAAKIRHHGKPTVIGYSPGSNLNGVSGVPLRLSATEVEGEESDDDDATVQRQHHRRTGSSGRNSIASGRRAMAYRTSGGLGPASGATKWSPSATPERTGSLVDDRHSAQAFPADDSGSAKARSFGSGSSGERLDNVPELTGNSAHLATNSTKHATVTREKSVKGVDELKRRGSVDERTATMTAGRLYIANPD